MQRAAEGYFLPSDQVLEMTYKIQWKKLPYTVMVSELDTETQKKDPSMTAGSSMKTELISVLGSSQGKIGRAHV